MPFLTLSLASAVMLASYYIDRNGLFPKFGLKPAIGHVTRAYGTVKHLPALKWGRLETGRSLLIPLRLGDQLQTGEDSAAEVLFYGGAVLQIEPGSMIKFEDDGENVSLRMILGRGYLELPSQAFGSEFGFRKSDGTEAKVPKGRRLVLSLSAVERLEEAVEVQVVESDRPDTIDNLELRYLAHGEVINNAHLILVHPIELDGDPGGLGQEDRSNLALIKRPRPLFPEREAEVDIEANPTIAMTWDKVRSPSEEDEVIAYEIVVKPAFKYKVQDTARRYQVFKAKPKAKANAEGELVEDLSFPIEKVGGGGVFLWSVRAVTASGKRGPSSTKRWLEIRFPKQLLAPELLKPQIE